VAVAVVTEVLVLVVLVAVELVGTMLLEHLEQ
jgi:hypothetical protein